MPPTVAGGYDERRATAVPSSSAGTVRLVMGMGGADGPDAERRRRFVAALVVLAMILGAAAVVLSTLLS
jgi:hypothetical protein